MRLLVCGSRGWTDRALLERVLDEHLDDLRDHFDEEPTVVEGEGRGADRLARAWGESRGLDVERHPADWDEHGRGAGFKRNAEMVALDDLWAVVAFSTSWPATPGTAHTCRLAYELGLPVFFVTPDGRQRRLQRGEPAEEL